MKKILINIASNFLAFLVLFSSVSFTVEKHYCGGQLYSESFFGHAKECGMSDMDGGICKINSHNIAVSKKSCCKTDFKFINGSQFKKESLIDVTSKYQYFFAKLNSIDYKYLLKKEFNVAIFSNYFPPPIIKNLNILFRVFRI